MALFTVAAATGALTIGLGSATITTGITGLFATVSAFALNTVVSIGLNLAVAAAAGQQTPTFSTQGKLQAGGDVSRSIMLGYGATAGSLVYANTWGRTNKAKNAYLTMVIAVSDWRVSGFPGAWANGGVATLLTGEADPEKGIPVSEYRVKGRDHLWMKFYDGTQTAADPFLVSKVSSAERPYGANRVGYGVAYVIVTARVSNTLWTGFPTFKFAVNGAPLYDVSKDSTAGGDGSHRYDDPETWGGDGDHLPAVQLYNLARGFYTSGNWFYGMQRVTAARLPAASWITEIAKCRATVTVEGVPEPTYRTGGEVPVNAEIGNAVKAILTGCNGRLSEIAGSYDLKLGAPGAPSFSFSDDDIISTEPQRFTPFFGLAETVTGVTGKYPSPADGWNEKACPPIYRADLEAKAGNRRLLVDVPFDMVPYAAQAQRLLNAAIEEAQRERRHTHVLPPRYWKYAVPGATCEWTVSTRNGYVTKLFRVDGVVDRANLDVMVDITEVDPNDHNPGVFVPPAPSPVGPVIPPPEANPDFDAEGYTIVDADGNGRRPSIKVKYPGDLDDVRAEWVQVRLAGDTEIIYSYDIPYGDQDADGSPMREVALNGTFLPATGYQARGKHVPISDRETEWSPWVSVTTPNVRLTYEDVYPPGIGDLGEDVRELQKWVGQSIRDVMDELLAIATLADAADLSGYDNTQILRRELASTRDGLTASYREAIVVATGPSSALSMRVEALEVVVPGLASASALNALTVRVDGIDADIVALGDLILGVETEVGNFSASGKFRVTTETTPGDAQARIGLSVAASGAGATKTAAIFLDAMASGDARVTIDAPNLYFGDISGGATPVNPLVYTGGIWRVENVRIGTVYFDQLSSSNAKLLIKGSGSDASIEIFS